MMLNKLSCSRSTIWALLAILIFIQESQCEYVLSQSLIMAGNLTTSPYYS